MFRLVVHEHERVSVTADRKADERVLLEHELDALLRACRHSKTMPFVVGHRNVKFNQQCGVIQAPGICVEILPKVADDDGFDRGLLLRMLVCAAGFDVERRDGIALRLQTHTIIQAVLEWFCDELSTQCHTGLLREYVSHLDALPAIRGRWRPALDLGRGQAHPGRLSCEFDELTADNRYNRAMKAALRAARALATGSGPLLRRIDMLLDWFAEVEDQRVSAADVERLPRNRLVARFGAALDMAAWLLSRRAPDLRHGDASGVAMLFDMNELFQACLGRLLRRSLPPGYQLREEGPRYHLSLDRSNERRFQMKPDFCILHGSKVAAIIDAKWKRLTPVSANGCWGIQQADMYQLHAYATAYECANVALWYPAHRGTDARAERPVFRFLTAGRNPGPASLAIDWIPLFEDRQGRSWIDAVTHELTACLDRMGVSNTAPETCSAS